MAPDPRLVELFSFYRDAELRGAALLFRLLPMMTDDAEATVELTLHVAQEAQHAWLWTRRIAEMGATPLRIETGYQTRMGRRVLPHGIVELLALTLVVEARSLARYTEHAARPDVDEATRRVLRVVTADEQWHLAWMRRKLDRLVEGDPVASAHVRDVSVRYARIEEAVYQELVRYERVTFATKAE